MKKKGKRKNKPALIPWPHVNAPYKRDQIGREIILDPFKTSRYKHTYDGML